MSKNRKITTEEMNYLNNMPPLHEKGTKEAKNYKYELMDAVKKVYGDSWYASPKSIKVIDQLCHKAVQQGFSFESPESISKKTGVSKRQVDNVIKFLIDNKLVFKKNKYNPIKKSKGELKRSSNGNGKAVYFFVMHPYFNQIMEYLNVDSELLYGYCTTNCTSDCIPENAEVPCESKVEEPENSSTYSLPTNLPILKDNMNNHLNADHEKVEPVTPKKKFFKYVPKMINEIYANTFDDSLVDLWRRVSVAFRNVKSSVLTKEDMLRGGRSVLQFLIQKLKEKNMSRDEMCAYVYSGAYEAFWSLNNSKIDQELAEEISEDRIDNRVVDHSKLPDYIRNLDAIW